MDEKPKLVKITVQAEDRRRLKELAAQRDVSMTEMFKSALDWLCKTNVIGREVKK